MDLASSKVNKMDKGTKKVINRKVRRVMWEIVVTEWEVEGKWGVSVQQIPVSVMQSEEVI